MKHVTLAASSTAQIDDGHRGGLIRVRAVRRKELIRSIRRKANLAAWNDYIGFAVSKFAGLGALAVGGLEYLDPNLLHLALKNPGLIAGSGLALLTGKNLISLIAKIEKGVR